MDTISYHIHKVRKRVYDFIVLVKLARVRTRVFVEIYEYVLINTSTRTILQGVPRLPILIYVFVYNKVVVLRADEPEAVLIPSAYE